MLLKKYIINYLNEAKGNIYRPKSKTEYNVLFDYWLQTVFSGAVENFEPFVKAVYKNKNKKNALLEVFPSLRYNKGKIKQPENVLISYLSERVAEEGKFKKEMLGDFFLENYVCPSDVYYILRKFIVPNKDFATQNPYRNPSSLASSPQFRFSIDENMWNEVKGMGSTQDWSEIWGSDREKLRF
jgi:hypothetical protein